MRRAVIDIGSNATRLLVGALENGNFVSHLFVRVPVALGRDSYGAKKTIAAAAQKKLIAALSGLQKIAAAMDAETCVAAATAAVRDCQNRRAVLAEGEMFAAVPDACAAAELKQTGSA
ncbi:MAG: hypothetical protein HAW59_04320, partial [Betaproteobacteria bacterium]|nr:hypothetical protein [Betaproteobacteria bacterium]